MKVIKSCRKTVALEILPDMSVIVRAPYRMPEEDIERFVASKKPWLDKNLAKMRLKLQEKKEIEQKTQKLGDEAIRKLADEALKDFPERVKRYAPLVGVTYGRITIRNQKTRWGSCSSGGNLNFNCLLMLTPPEVRNSVVVHELCHRKEMNHSREFYAEVLRVFPEYYKWDKWLRENGKAIMYAGSHA